MQANIVDRDPESWNIYNYDHHVDVIREFLLYKKRTLNERTRLKSWSFGSWAKKLNISSAAALTNIMKQRNLPSHDLIQRMCESMELGTIESEYFTLLVERVRNKDSIDLVRQTIENRIIELRRLNR